ncbi:MAG TPA: hypothetical protein DD640_08860 [Clostridiales bacterium]|nr:hypothetical protein [Clostridiales bacterium]
MMAMQLWFCGLSLLLGLAVYHGLPSLVRLLDRRLAMARLQELPPVETGKRWSCPSILPAQWRQSVAVRMQKAGYFAAQAHAGYWIWHIAPVPGFLLLARLLHIDGAWPVWVGVLLITLADNQISRKIKCRKKSFSKSLFKIYRFLDLQLTSGIKVTDALRGLPEAIRDPVVRPVLIRFAALYELTLDLDQSLAEIRLAFPGPDCELLATHLRQCLQTGQAGHTLARMEELLFARYFNMMQADTAQIRTQLLLTAILGVTPGVVLFLYPLLSQAIQAVESVFG